MILLDSLNRHMLGAYGGREFDTPNLDRMAKRSVRFTRHYTGSLPCMPARHDLLCGQLDFLWRPWGSVEAWEDTIVHELEGAGVVSMLVSDHPHLFETGGENYHVDFTGWEYLRGHAGDTWKTRPDPSWEGAPTFQNFPVADYHRSRSWFRGEEEFPGPKTMAHAAQWIDENAGWHDRFFLLVDEFDPHEPLDTPEPWASMYDPAWEGPRLIHPPYHPNAIATGVLSPAQAHNIRCNYGAKLSMIDAWLGRVLDAIDRNQLWDDTAVILCTDHGLFLGEKDIFGKPGAPAYEPLSHIPLMVSMPGVDPGTCDALTTAVDVFATLADLFGVTPRQRTSGHSLLPLLRGTEHEVREWALSGVWGREVHLIHGGMKYVCAPPKDNAPLSMWSNRWSTMPTRFLRRGEELPLPDGRAVLDYMPGSGVPVIRQRFDAGDHVPYWARTKFTGDHLYDVDEDPEELRNLVGTPRAAASRDALHDVLRAVEAPVEQFERLGLG